MAYTVKKLAQLAGVSVRTLHFYDEVGLLSPAYYGDNHYRYYEEEQLLLLQQILFFRHLGFSLNDIKRIISSDDFDKVETLKSHKVVLKERLEQTKKLIKTIDKTIEHLRGDRKMNHKELYYGLDSELQKSYEKHLVEQANVDQAVIEQSRNKVKHWKKEDWDKYKQQADALNQALVSALNDGLEPGCRQVQELINQHYQMVKLFWTPTKESYVGLGMMYREHPDFRKFYQAYHPQLLTFLAAAMEIFAEETL